MSFEDDFLNDFGDNKDEEDDDFSSSEEDGLPEDENEEEDVGAEVLESGSDIPKNPLRQNQEYIDLLQLLRRSPEDISQMFRLEELLDRCNQTLNKIVGEIGTWHRRACRLYQPAFPELEKLVPEPVDFARVILAYGESDEADLAKILPSATVMVVKVSKSAHIAAIATMGDKSELRQALEAASQIIALEEDRHTILHFVEAQMKTFAPNLYDLVGSRAAALLVGIAGGLDKLARIPSNDIQVMGRKKSSRADTGVVHGANVGLHRHAGILAQCPLVLSAPAQWRRKTLRVVAGRVALAARVDESKRDRTSGKMWKEEIEKKIEHWLEPGPGKARKALPVPDAVRPKRRGGRRARKQKEKLGLTTMRTLANREKFGEGSETVEYSVAAMGQDLGMLTKGANGRVRANQVKDNQRLGQAAAKKLRPINAGIGGAGISGFSSLAFTPVQGMELVAKPSTSGSSMAAASGTSGARPGAVGPTSKRPAVPLFHQSSKT